MTNKAAVVIFTALFLVSFTATGSAQYVFRTPTPTPTPKPTPKPPPAVSTLCPTINVQAQPGQIVRDGQRMFFTANIAGGDPKVIPVIVWNTTAGTVVQGQNTRRIEVDTAGAGSSSDRELRAEIWVGGYAPECMMQASGMVRIIPPAVKFGEFGEVDEATFKRNLETLSTFLSQTPDSLYLIAYAGRNSDRSFTVTWVRRIRDALTAAGLSPGRLRATDGGLREEPMFEFWTVPSGAVPPQPTPTLKRSDLAPRTAPAKRP